VVLVDQPVNLPIDLGGSASTSLWPRVRVLLFCAKHLFIAAMVSKPEVEAPMRPEPEAKHWQNDQRM
jgi:hypothetical protein